MPIRIHKNVFRFKVPMDNPALVKMCNGRHYLSSIKSRLILATQQTSEKVEIKTYENIKREYKQFSSNSHTNYLKIPCRYR